VPRVHSGLVRPRLAGVALLIVATGACAGVGTGPLPGQPAHHVAGGFRNPWPDYRRPDAWVRWRFLAAHTWGLLMAPRTFDPPRESVEAVASGRALWQGNPIPSITWVGHATVLLHLDGVNILTDPHWGERASPVSWAGPQRLSPPGIPFDSLPPIHAVVISHDHYDHLDVSTVRRLARTHDPIFVVPLGLRRWFDDIGIRRVEELDWWDERRVAGVRIVAAPSQHWAQRSPFDLNRRLWASWLIVGAGRRFYFSGDTGYFQGFREIGRRLGPIDVAALAIGAYLPRDLMQAHHVTPEEAVQAFEDLGARVLLGIHWGTFDLSSEPLDEPPRQMRAALERRGIAPDRAWLFKLGETRRW
jgi:N-acyl-phosphatidylethanolamine-hydrolysing phospholipase D